MTGREAAEQVADNVAFRLIARTAMIVTPVLMAIFGWVALDYLSAQREINADLKAQVSVVAESLSGIQTRVAVLEANSNRGRQDRQDAEARILAKQEQMQQAMVDFSTRLATVSARLEVLLQQRHAGAPGDPP